jgi:hypothetical protein
MFSKTLREMTLAEVIAECNADPGEPLATPPGVIIGGPLLPGPVVARAALHAKVVPIVHPGNAPPETRYVPSAALADFVRSRDLTCRFPHCNVPADRCDTDHTITYRSGRHVRRTSSPCAGFTIGRVPSAIEVAPRSPHLASIDRP